MAASYVTTGTNRTTQVIGGKPTDVQVVDVTTIPHGVQFQRAVPYSVWTANSEAELLAPAAEAIESRMGDDFIGGAIGVQDVDASSLLAYGVEFTVWLPANHDFTTTVTVPVDLLAGTDTFQGQIVAQQFQDALAHLQHTASL